MAMNKPTADGGEYDLLYFSAGLVTLAATIIFSIYFKGFLGMISILAGIIIGYVYSLIVGIVDFTPVMEAKWFEWPPFIVPFVDYEVKYHLGYYPADGSNCGCNDF